MNDERTNRRQQRSEAMYRAEQAAKNNRPEDAAELITTAILLMQAEHNEDIARLKQLRFRYQELAGMEATR